MGVSLIISAPWQRRGLLFDRRVELFFNFYFHGVVEIFGAARRSFGGIGSIPGLCQSTWLGGGDLLLSCA